MFRCCLGKRKDIETDSSDNSKDTPEDKLQLTKNVGKMGVQKTDLTFEGMYPFFFCDCDWNWDVVRLPLKCGIIY